MRLIHYGTAAAALIFLTLNGLPVYYAQPRSGLPPPEDDLPRYPGAIHIHSRYSDGGGSITDIVRAARKTGLRFLIITDHSTIQPLVDGYQGYHDSVLTLIGEEVNTGAGHLLALGLSRHIEQNGPQGLPALLDTIAGERGIAIIAHPDGRRPWTDWRVGPIHGIEALNADSEWRNDGLMELLGALIWYPLMPEGAFNSLVDRPDSILARWIDMNRKAPVSGVASVDAHARIPLAGEYALAFPSYQRLFGLLRTYVITQSTLTGEAETDRRMILDGLASGRCYMAVDGYEPARRFGFELYSQDGIIPMGGETAYRDGLRLRVTAESSGPTRIRIFRDGRLTGEYEEPERSIPVSEPGIYHAEVYQMRSSWPFSEPAPRLWIISNPIRVKKTV